MGNENVGREKDVNALGRENEIELKGSVELKIVGKENELQLGRENEMVELNMVGRENEVKLLGRENEVELEGSVELKTVGGKKEAVKLEMGGRETMVLYECIVTGWRIVKGEKREWSACQKL